jgi:coenzyme F420-dependent glucose-6-phosphate dehydrogenase
MQFCGLQILMRIRHLSHKNQVVQTFEHYGIKARPKYGKLTVCWAETTAKARETAYKYWPTAGLKGDLSQELPTPTHFEHAAQMVTEEHVADTLICSNDPEAHLKGIQKFIDAGFDHIYVHQVGPDQEAFFNFYQRFILPVHLQQK